MSEDVLRKFQKLKADEWATTVFWMEQGLLPGPTIERYVNEMVALRYGLAVEYLSFAREIAGRKAIHHRNVISRCHAAMYQAARAVVLHYKRYDQENGRRLIKPISESLGGDCAEVLQRWRSIRNDVEYSPCLEVAIQAGGLEFCRKKVLDEASEFLEKARIYLAERGCQV